MKLTKTDIKQKRRRDGVGKAGRFFISRRGAESAERFWSWGARMLAHPSGSASPNLPFEAKLLRRISPDPERELIDVVSR